MVKGYQQPPNLAKAYQAASRHMHEQGLLNRPPHTYNQSTQNQLGIVGLSGIQPPIKAIAGKPAFEATGKKVVAVSNTSE